MQTPGVSAIAGSTPLGPLGLAHAGVSAAGGVLVAGLRPPVWTALDRQLGVEAQARALASSELGRFVLETRLLVGWRERVGLT